MERQELLSDLSDELSADRLQKFEDLALQMEMSGKEKDAPVREVFSLLGDKWSTLILLVLAISSLRHATLRRVIKRLSAEEAISQRMLTLKLRALERNGLVSRHVTDEVPPRVDYSLTALGHELITHVRLLIRFINDHHSDICHARSHFESES